MSSLSKLNSVKFSRDLITKFCNLNARDSTDVDDDEDGGELLELVGLIVVDVDEWW